MPVSSHIQMREKRDLRPELHDFHELSITPEFQHDDIALCHPKKRKEKN